MEVVVDANVAPGIIPPHRAGFATTAPRAYFKKQVPLIEFQIPASQLVVFAQRDRQIAKLEIFCATETL
jgi:hypothetical protein